MFAFFITSSVSYVSTTFPATTRWHHCVYSSCKSAWRLFGKPRAPTLFVAFSDRKSLPYRFVHAYCTSLDELYRVRYGYDRIACFGDQSVPVEDNPRRTVILTIITRATTTTIVFNRTNRRVDLWAVRRVQIITFEYRRRRHANTVDWCIFFIYDLIFYNVRNTATNVKDI